MDEVRAVAERIEANIARALQRRRSADRPFTEELRRFAAQYRQWLAVA